VGTRDRSDFFPCDHEYFNFRGSKFSRSRGAFVKVPYFLSRHVPGPLRHYLTATAPETRDTAIRDLENRESGRACQPGELDGKDWALLEKVVAGFETVGELPQGRLQVVRGSFGFSGQAWAHAVRPYKENRQATATSVYVTRSVHVVDNLKTMPAPTLCVPQAAQPLACGANTWGTTASCDALHLAPGR
jgi:hypothetical protein